MKFSTLSTFALAAFSVVASPVAQATEPKNTLAKREIDLSTVLGDVDALLESLVSDVEGVADAAGVDISGLLEGAGITLVHKRDEITGEMKREFVLDEKRSVSAVVAAVEKLIGDLLKSLVKLAGDVGVSLLGELAGLGL